MSYNVNRQVNDPFYRYKMPKLSTKVEGKGNGIKTVVTNMVDIAKALSRNPEYPTKYFGQELGAQTQIDSKNDRYIVNGAHTSERLQDVLDGFIRNYVLCVACQNPETVLRIRGGKEIQSKCKACGHQTLLKSGRINQFIIKNPPKKEPKVTGGKSGAAVLPGNDMLTTNAEEPAEGPDEEAAEAPEEPEKPQQQAVEEAWQPQAGSSLEELSAAVRDLCMDEGVVRTEAERVTLFLYLVRTRVMPEGVPPAPVSADVAAEIRREADRLELGHRAILPVLEIIWAGRPPRLVISETERCRQLLVRFTRSGPEQAQRRAQQHVFSVLEEMCGSGSGSGGMRDGVQNVLHALYTADVLPEEALLRWYDSGDGRGRGGASVMRERCAAFIQWLREADEEDSEEEEDDAGGAQGEATESADAATSVGEESEQTGKTSLKKIGNVADILDASDDSDINIDDI